MDILGNSEGSNNARKSTMRTPALVALCSSILIATPALAQNEEGTAGFISVNEEAGAPVARVTDPKTNDTLVVRCNDGTLALVVRYGGLSMQGVPEQEGEVMIAFESRGGSVEVPATSRRSEGSATSAADTQTAELIRNALRSFSAMTSDDVGTVTIRSGEGQDIGTIAVSGKGTTRAYGEVMQSCRSS